MSTEEPSTKVLVVEPRAEKIVPIRTAGDALHEIEKVEAVSSVKDANNKLELNTYGIVFLSDSLPKEEITKAIEKEKAKEESFTTFILITPTQTGQSADITTKLMSGLDGILCEPFSVQTFTDALELAREVRKKSIEKRRKKLIDLTLIDAATFIDAAANNQKRPGKRGVTISALTKLRTTLESFFDTSPDIYFEVVVSRFIKISSQAKDKKVLGYSGASKRVREKMEQKLKAKLEASDAKQEESPSAEAPEEEKE